MSTTITRYLDLIGQQLTSAPMWIQVAVVLAGSVPLCLVLAFVLLRIIDVAGARTYRLFNGVALERRVDRVRSKPAEHKPRTTRIVIEEEPR